MTTRIGIVPYLNMLPLLEGLEHVQPSNEWLRATPRDLARHLATGRVDIASISTFEGIRCAADYKVLPGAGIGSDGAVRSVALYSRVPLGEIKRIQLDRASLSSINLFRILAVELLGINPVYELSDEPLGKNGATTFGAEFDACVVIGDTALRWENAWPHHLDLGAGWKELTGLPFVFAGWWCRRNFTPTGEDCEAFVDARRRGESRIDTIVDRLDGETLACHGGRDSLLDYFSRAIKYDVDDSSRRGMELFRTRLIHHGLLPETTGEIRWVDGVGAGHSSS